MKFFEFFVILQKEYIVAELRKKIYPDISGKKKCEEIMTGKKKKIFDIAMKNSIKTIFPDMKLGNSSMYDEDLRIKLYKEVYGEDFDFPKFIYRDEIQRKFLAEKDRKCYYSINSEIKTIDGIGILREVWLEKNICSVEIDNICKKYFLNKVSRIL